MKIALVLASALAVSACMSSGGGKAPVNGPVTPTASPKPQPKSGPGPTTPNRVENNSFAGLLNNVRIANGAGAVAYDNRLGAAAQGHANDMLAHNYLSHTGRDGSSAGDRITRAGYNWRTYGENIAQGQDSQSDVLKSWTNSPGHHANNINPNFKDFGLGKAGSGSNKRWVLLLAAEN
ncbi:CAP domain-containing protein [Aliiroseovarius crassostreae]|uniref:CAP domain-containing protein n=1 Tax=Aliiroseovarius crassostreae TaxID=154981 RepID=UPI003C7D6309